MRRILAYLIVLCCVSELHADCPSQHMVRVPIGGSLESFHQTLHAAPSRGGARVVFSTQRRLLPSDLGTNDGDVYLFDAASGMLTLETDAAGTAGGGDPLISAHGDRLLFRALPGYPTQPVGPGSRVYTKLTGAAEVSEVSTDAATAYTMYASLSPDGEWAVYAEVNSPMTPGLPSTPVPFAVLAKNLLSGESISVAPPAQGPLTSPLNAFAFPSTSVSNGADVVVFSTSRPDLVSGDTNQTNDVFVYRRAQQQLVRVTSPSGEQLDGPSFDARVSADGRFVVFTSAATNTGIPGFMLGESQQLYVYSVESGGLERVSVNSSERAATDDCDSPTISGDGRYVCFSSKAPNLAGGAFNDVRQVYLRDRLLGVTYPVSVAADGAVADRDCVNPKISIDGAAIAFLSEAGNLTPGDTVQQSADLFVRYLPAELALVEVSGSQSVFWGESAQFRCVVRARETVEYQWCRDGSALKQSDRVRGVQTDTLEVDTTECGDRGAYSVVVSDACGQEIESESATLMVGPPGDFDGNGAVELLDLSTLLTNFGTTSATRAMGDATGDAAVDLVDLAVLLTHFGSACD